MTKDLTEMSNNELLHCYNDGGQDEIVRRMRAAGAKGAVPKTFQGGFASLDEKDCLIWSAHRDRLVAWTRDFSKETQRGPYLSGPLGCGKSHLAWAVVHELKVRGFKVVGWNVSKLFNALLDSFGNKFCEPSTAEIMEGAQDADLLLLDDLGAEPADAHGNTKPWVLERLYVIGNTRLENEKPIMVTSNLNGNELKKHMPDDAGRRFIDRLTGMIELPGMAFDPKSKSMRRG